MPLFVRINEDLEKQFRIRVIEKYGSQKGSLEKALEEAIKDWIEKPLQGVPSKTAKRKP